MEHAKHLFLLGTAWLMSLNPDPIAKWAGIIASISVIVSSVYSIKKNRLK